MKIFAASVAVWCALVLAGLHFVLPTRLLYWSGVALVVFWIVFGTVWLFRQTRGRPPET
ncbi:MAG: hypothetical protein K8R60_23705 [Burkholderiales bacterium]|nr:hypothetical protein [Burkholderiales bacterium]